MPRPAKKHKTPPAPAVSQPRATGESRGADFVTVGWLLTVFMAALSELGALAAWGAGELVGDAEWLGVLRELLFFAALVIGTVGLGLTWSVIRARRTAPPRSLVRFALLVGVAPWLAWGLAAALR